ncbi:MAG: type 2 isopentenyl-diphosphate Delta-isomerase [Saprospiraceae bacterium]|nr:type 2 isopentenyl-diphosphate Delta-isomerase [Saprospiraceae bacterium]
MDHLEQKKKQAEDDPTAAARKRDHIDMAFRSQVLHGEVDGRFHYEPLLTAHPQPGSLPPFSFLGKTLRTPLWVSSMTGGTDWAHTINHNLARACAEFGMGMGLGSCRSLLFSDDTLEDFAVRHLIGPELPLYANLGVAQLEQLIDKQELGRVTTLLEKLQADGLIIHVNPLQEWMQPEGDRFQRPPLQTVQTILEKLPDVPLIVKEVGQGMGPASLRALLQLPLQAVDFAAAGGTNFAKLELLRSEEAKAQTYGQLAQVGHTAAEMVQFTNQIAAELGDQMRCRQIIISGGIGGFLDGFYLMKKLQVPSVYGQASGFLKHARGSYEELWEYVAAQVRGVELAEAFLIPK